MTTASKITIARIALIPFFFVVALWEFQWHNLVALAIFAFAAFTDSLDGYVARRYDQVSSFGKFIDPLADKFLVVAALLIFVSRGQMAPWACFLVLLREFAVTGLRLVAVEKGTVIAAGWSGKIKTVASFICICIMFLPFYDHALLPWLSVNDLCVFIIVVTTLYSGIVYFIANWAAVDFKT